MQVVSIVVYFALTGFPFGVANLTGTWALDRTRSDFGGGDVPSHYELQIEQAGNYLAVTTLSEDVSGRRVTYRQCRLDDQVSGLVRCLAADGPDETWRVSGESLTVTRLAGRSRQKLVLGRCTDLE